MNDIANYVKAQWDRSIALAALLLGALTLLLGYLGISGTPHVAEQLPYFISAGCLGVLLVGVAGMMWVSADLRDQWRELRAIRVHLESAAVQQAVAPVTTRDALAGQAPAPRPRRKGLAT